MQNNIPRVIIALLVASSCHLMNASQLPRVADITEQMLNERSQYNQPDGIQKLSRYLDQGADINALCFDLETLFMHFSGPGSKTLVPDFLVSRGADINKPDRHGTTPLMKATQCDAPDSFFKLLFDHHVAINAQNLSGTTALIIATDRDPKVGNKVCLLLKHGAEPNIPDKWGRTPLMFAMSMGNKKAAVILLRYGANPHAKTMDEESMSQKLNRKLPKQNSLALAGNSSQAMMLRINTKIITKKNEEFLRKWGNKTALDIMNPHLLTDPEMQAALKEYEACRKDYQDLFLEQTPLAKTLIEIVFDYVAPAAIMRKNKKAADGVKPSAAFV